MNDTLTAVPGIRVGHATAPGGETGCTVILGPFRAAVDVRGLATGSRELGALEPEHLVPRVDAILLTGGSAYGLAAADGVMAWHEERGLGYRTGAGPVPIVPAAVVYDLAAGRPRPGPELGRAACDDAVRRAGGADEPGDGLSGEGDPGVEERARPAPVGRVGAGAGATVGKLAGPARSSPGGVGSAARPVGEWTVGALVVVNAVGNVVDRRGRVLAGARADDGGFLDSSRAVHDRSDGPEGEAEPLIGGTNTTLAVIGTDAPLSRIELSRLARMAATAMARAIDPVHTPFDGDVVFAVSTAPPIEDGRPRPGSFATGPHPSESLLRLGVVARDVLEDAIRSAVVPSPSLPEAEA